MISKSELAFFLILLGVTSALLFSVLAPFIQTILLGVIGAVVFYPVYTRLCKDLGKRETLAALITVLIALLLVLLPLLYLGSELFSETRGLYESVSVGGSGESLAEAENFINQFLVDWGWGAVELNIPELQGVVKNISAWFAINFGLILGNFFLIAIKIAIWIVAFYYFLRNGLSLRHELVSLSPLSEVRSKKIIERCEITIRSVIEGSLIIALIQGVVAIIGFFIFGVPQPVILGLTVVLASLVPGIGPMLVFSPVAIYSFITGNTFGALGVLVWGFLIVGLIDNVLRPFLMRRYLVIPELFIFLSVIGGIMAFGPLGFIWGPVILGLFLVLLDLYKEIVLGR